MQLMRWRSAALAVCATVIGAACASAPSEPAPGKGRIVDVPGLSLTATMSSRTLHLGDDATLQLSARNEGAAPLRLDFPSGCQLLPWIERASDGEVVHPGGGGWGCTQAITSLTLAPGEAKTSSTGVHAGLEQLAIYTGAVLPVGKYRAYATLGVGPRVQATSEKVEFEVVP